MLEGQVLQRLSELGIGSQTLIDFAKSCSDCIGVIPVSADHVHEFLNDILRVADFVQERLKSVIQQAGFGNQQLLSFS
jgi:hypothetical protein